MAQPSTYVVNTSRSPHARLRPVSLTEVTLSDGFWAPRLRLNREVTLPAQHRILEETGRIDNFRRASGKKAIEFQGFFFNDSDVYKWLEAVAWSLAREDDPALTRLMEAVIDEVAAAQQPDGYLNTFFVLDKAAERWTNLFAMHELYCAGHLIQAAVAHHRVTGSNRLLEIARRFADLICDTFGPPELGKQPGTCGHPEIEMALIELARETGEARYREQAQYFIDVRGQGLLGKADYCQDHRPFRKLRAMAGHAVRAVYLNAGATDLYIETGETALGEALNALWHNMTTRRLYITGGIGARHSGESFGNDYELPNEKAYAETCAAIASVMWNWRMLQVSGDACYADLMEITLYNGVLAGISLDGMSYFYVNPLADGGLHRRQPWYECACCPTNIVRILSTLPAYLYSVSEAEVWVHLYVAGRADLRLPDGRTIELMQHTQYPWEGDVTLEVTGEGTFSVLMRIPAWCEDGAMLTVNGQPIEGDLIPGAYAEIRRAWQPGDTVHLALPMPVRCMECIPHVADNVGRVALMRGPLVYCVEGVDHPGADLDSLVLLPEAGFAHVFQPDLLGGVVIVQGYAGIAPPDEPWGDRLYRRVDPAPSQLQPTIRLTAIPYYAWANREPGPMRVWLRSR